MIYARNVTNDPHSNFYACSEFLDKVTNAYLICGALHHFNMETLAEDPRKNIYTGDPNDKQTKQTYVKEVLKSFIEDHVVANVPELSQKAPTSNDLKCRFCDRRYIRPSALKNHEEKEHNFSAVQHNSGNQPPTENALDKVYNYTHQALLLLLLRLNHEDAIKLADGGRILRLNKFFCLFYKISKCPKYAIATLHLQAQVNCLLSPRLAHSLTWNRFVNHQGKIDSNLPMDKEVEHDNLAFKTDIHSYKGEITDKSIARVSHSTSPTDEILSGFDKCTQIRKPSGKHTEVSTEGDISALVEQFLEADLYRKIPGRKHSAFPEMKHNLLTDLNVNELKSWISNSLKKFSRKHFYKIIIFDFQRFINFKEAELSFSRQKRL